MDFSSIDSSRSNEQNENKRLGRNNFKTFSYSGSILNKPSVNLSTKNNTFIFNGKNKGKKRETAEEKFDAIFRKSDDTQPKKMKICKSSLFDDSDEDTEQKNGKEPKKSSGRLSSSQPVISLSRKSPVKTFASEFDFSCEKRENHQPITLNFKNTKQKKPEENKYAKITLSEFDTLFDSDDDDEPTIQTSYRSSHLRVNKDSSDKKIKLGSAPKVTIIKNAQISSPQKARNGTVLKKITKSPQKSSCSNPIKVVSSPTNKKINVLLSKDKIFTDKKSNMQSIINTDKKSIDIRIQNNPTHVDDKKEPKTKTKAPVTASYNSRPWIDSTKDAFELDTKFAKPDSMSKNSSPSNNTMQKSKSTYTYVKHVKNYQNCLDEGEDIRFKDELDYSLEGIQLTQTTLIRCLSVIKLAQNCKELNFRLYLRAHNVGDKIFEHLSDSKQHESLALATALLFFTLSRDRQFEINKTTLGLLLQLIDPLEKEKSTSYNANMTENVKNSNQPALKYKFFKSKMSGGNANINPQNISGTLKSVEEVLGSCKDDLIDGNNITAKLLASEAFLRFNARRTPSWYKDEVRLKGGLDHIILLVKNAIEELHSTEDENLQQRKLVLLVRFFAVLENTVKETPMNVMYLITHDHAVLIKKISSLLTTCSNWLQTNYKSIKDKALFESAEVEDLPSIYKSFYNCLFKTFKLLVYITNDSEWLSSRVGEEEGILPQLISSIFSIPEYLHPRHRFELLVASLSLLVNLVESSPKNRITLMRMKINETTGNLSLQNSNDKPVVQLIVELFVSRESEAEENEILGEVGSKRALKKSQITTSSSQPSKEQSGHWVESNDEMEWVPSVEPGSQGSQSSQRSTTSEFSSQADPESMLNDEQKTEMKQTLDKANEHMEHSLIASYAALVLGCLIHGSHANLAPIRSYLPTEEAFASVIAMLKKFYSFMTLMAGISKKGEKTLSIIIEDLEELTSKPPLKL